LAKTISIYCSPDGIITAVYVDDILVAAPTQHLTRKFYDDLAHFRIENKGPPTTFLGLNITRTANLLNMNQTGYIERMLARFSYDDDLVDDFSQVSKEIPYGNHILETSAR
jgi:Reverse transcriptase (RNA-dependent DNA polymerase)